MIPYLPLPVLPTPSSPLIHSRSVTSMYSRQDSLTVAVPPTSIQETPSYGPTPTPGIGYLRETQFVVNCSFTVKYQWILDKSNIQ